MGFFSKAKSGKAAFSTGILLIRFSIGFIFLFAGAKKILNLQSFIESVQEAGKMDDTLAFILAFTLPFIEMLFGGLYIIGLFTPVASFFIACMTVGILFFQGVGHPELPYNQNVVILCCAIATMFTGAGLISFDALIDSVKISKTPDKGHVKQTEFRETSNPVKSTETERIVIEDKPEKRDTPADKKEGEFQ